MGKDAWKLIVFDCKQRRRIPVFFVPLASNLEVLLVGYDLRPIQTVGVRLKNSSKCNSVKFSRKKGSFVLTLKGFGLEFPKVIVRHIQIIQLANSLER